MFHNKKSLVFLLPMKSYIKGFFNERRLSLFVFNVESRKSKCSSGLSCSIFSTSISLTDRIT